VLQHRQNFNHHVKKQSSNPSLDDDDNVDACKRGGIEEAAFGNPRDFLTNKFVYLVLSSRANGLSIGVNLNPSVKCSLQCRYCEVDRNHPVHEGHLDVSRMAMELRETLELAEGGWLRQWPRYAKLPPELLKVQHVAISGDGEPLLSDVFIETLKAVIQVRTTERFFKIVLFTNSMELDRPQAKEGLALLAPGDEVWAKLDGGTQKYVERVNGSNMSLDRVLKNILSVASQRPVVIQSLFLAIEDEEPADVEIEEYARRLKELKGYGAKIPLVQIYSANRPMARPGCSRLPLKSLSRIAKTVRRIAGLRTEVF